MSEAMVVKNNHIRGSLKVNQTGGEERKQANKDTAGHNWNMSVLLD
jgi:hypothetical protein